jgi:phage terminase large subunit
VSKSACGPSATTDKPATWNFPTTRIFSANIAAWRERRRLIVNQGGTSSSKTFSILQLLYMIAKGTRLPLLISVVSESLPHLRRGCIRDWEMILGPAYDPDRFNKTEHIYHFPRADIEFFPADEASKLRGGRRDILFINEANNALQHAFDELDVRTRLCTFLDYNPVSEFWAHELLRHRGITDFTRSESREDCAFIHSTYMDARHVLPDSVIAAVESRRDRDPNWWNVYGLGLVGNVEGLVHPLFGTIDDLPEGGVVFYGLDFGFASSPSALVKCVLQEDRLYCDQLIYETGLTNDQISRRMESLGLSKNFDEVFADAAEPKSIKEIADHGWNIKPAPKGEDSVRNGIDRINQLKQFWTKRSVDAIKEMRNYRYIETSDGKLTNKPIDDYNHALDGRRYAVVGKMTGSPSLFVVNTTSATAQRTPKRTLDMIDLAGLVITEREAVIVTCLYNPASQNLYVAGEKNYGDIDGLVEYIKKSKARVISGENITSVSTKSISDALTANGVYVETDGTLDELGVVYWMRTMLDKGALTINAECVNLIHALQGETDIKKLAPHTLALLYVVNNLYKTGVAQPVPEYKPFLKEKMEFLEQIKRGTPIERNVVKGWYTK